MKVTVPSGVWPTMVTPFEATGGIDYPGLADLVEWYLRHEIAGLFAVCQSSEMFHLSLEERKRLAEFVVTAVAGRVPVVASGNVSHDFQAQLREIEAMAGSGVDAVVLVTNRFAARDEEDGYWLERIAVILDRFPGMYFGLYECPYPYKRLLTPELLRECVETGRFLFVKDTTCDLAAMDEKVRIAGTGGLKIFNANGPTFLASLGLGIAGFSGVMANFHPWLYAWLMRNWRTRPKEAAGLQDFLGVASLIENRTYPINAKYALQLAGVRIGLSSRAVEAADFRASNRLEVAQLRALTSAFTERYLHPPVP